jgi:alkylation response protein AidB-like acyl-CoA dehydrogenase
VPLAPRHVTMSEDDAMLVDAVREFAEGELLERDRAWDKDESSVAEVLPKLAEMGLLGLLVPQEFGGLSCSYRTYAAILHELARCSPSSCVTVSVHSMVGTIIRENAVEPLRSQWLAEWSKPESFSAFCLSEAGAGSDARNITTEAVKVDGGYVVNGEKMWVTNGLNAQWLLVAFRIKDEEDRDKLTTVMIRGDSPGLSRDKIAGKMGIRGSETAVISLSDVFVPAEHLIGKPGDGFGVMLAGLNGGRISIAVQATGIAEACLEEMVSYARQREQFGQPIGKFQAVGDMIADSAAELEAARVLVWRAAGSVDAGNLTRSACSMAKLYASEAANRIAYRAVQVHGGTGYVNESRVEQLYRDARITSIYEGTSEIQRIVIARELAPLAPRELAPNV